MLTLVLGGARSGKSRYAEQCAAGSGKQVIYIATATAGDAEMHDRIARHRLDRPSSWETVEEPVELASILQRYTQNDVFVLVDCLTLWLNNILFDAAGNVQTALFQQQRQALMEALPGVAGEVVMVSNEVGQGVVPASVMARRFVDEAGRLHQSLARLCDHVVLITAGLPQFLK